ncbi:MAG: ClpXP protease specificity-enhancing factor SspB [Mariprofundaceae bacterium]|nr:ClpXP protease specificity-enhancing factor SspB [Mariprofundaceae bacterium]
MSLSFADAAKAKKLREFFARHGRIYIIVDATGDDVQVPDHLRGDPALRLVLNARMPQPIYIRDDALESEFSFSGEIYACRLPMHAIWATYLPDGNIENGIIWEEDVPETIRTIVQAVRDMTPDRESGAEEAAADEKTASPPGRKVRHLRVIK